MSVSADEIAAHGDEDHGVGDVDAFFVVTHEAPPAGHPAEGALHDPAARQDLEALLVVGSSDDLDDEVEVGRLVHEFQPIIGGVGEPMLHPRPALANGVQDRRRAGAVGDVGGGEVDHQQPPVGIDRDVALAADNLLSSVVTLVAAWGALTDWLSITAAEGLASRPARSRSTISARSWMVWNRNRRGTSRNQRATVCHGPRGIGNTRPPQPERPR